MKRVLLLIALLSGSCFANDYQPAAGATGAKIFSDACAACHGVNGEGKFGVFLGLASTTLKPTDMKKIIQQGGTLMPAFKNIQGEELNALIAHVSSFGVVIANGKK